MVPSSRMISQHSPHRGLGVAAALQHAVRLGQQREHVAGAAEILRPGVLLHALQGGDRPLGGGDAGGGGDVVDGDSKGGFVVVGVVRDHLGKLQLLDVRRRHGHADEPLGVGGHEVDVLRGGELGGADEVPLILPVRVVGDQDQTPLPELLQGLFNGVVRKHDGSSLESISG